MVEILSTKLIMPRPRANLVPRPRLVERLEASALKKLTLIAAPAGFGKTTLLSEWIPQSPRCVTWLSLDEGDNDLTQFWSYFISSLQGIHPNIGKDALALLQSPQSLSIPSFLTALINDVAAFHDSFATVLEDYHTIELQTIHDALVFLIDHLPQNFRLIITTRSDPPLPLARLRAHNKLAEFRANDLRFTADETSAFLARTMGLRLSADEIAALEARTEGWIAGLQIAALSMQGHNDIPGFIRAFSGSHRHILGYLAEEVLNRQTESTLNFLLQTSCLDRLCGPLCDAVTGESGGQMMLEDLELANLFIAPLDDEGVWYRYHQLFSEVLQARLRRTWPERLPELHRRAAGWFTSQSMVVEAIRHAIAGYHFEEAGRLIEAVAGDMLRRGFVASLARWLEAVPEKMKRQHPRLALIHGWTYFLGPALNLERAEEWAQSAMKTALEAGSLDSGLAAEVAGLQAMIASTRNEVERSLELSSQALDSFPPDSPWRGLVTFSLATAHYMSGDFAAAAPVFSEALKLSQTEGATFTQLVSASFLGEILVFQGCLTRAAEMYQQVLDWAAHSIPQKGGVMAYGGMAGILWERNQQDAALAHIDQGLAQADDVGGVWSLYVIQRVLVRAHQARGNWSAAMQILDQVAQVGERTQVALVVKQAAALRARLQLAQGDLEAAELWAMNSGLSPEVTGVSHPGLQEAEYLSLARLLAAQGRHPEAGSLLARLLQAAYAEERNGSAIAILVLLSSCHLALGNRAEALEALESALTLAEPEGYVRIFVDEGEPVQNLLTEFEALLKRRLSSGADGPYTRLLAYTTKLLDVFAEPTPPRTSQTPGTTVEPLSDRELEILGLIAAGCSNQQISEKLVIAVSTVKTHINHLYSKLGANSRTQALLIAQERGLLSH